MMQLCHYVVRLHMVLSAFAENVRRTQTVVEGMEMGRHKGRVKLILTFAVTRGNVKPPANNKTTLNEAHHHYGKKVC